MHQTLQNKKTVVQQLIKPAILYNCVPYNQFWKWQMELII